MECTITLFFYGRQRQISIGERVTVMCHKYGEAVGERATFAKLTSRYAEFITETGSRIKVYGMKTHGTVAWQSFRRNRWVSAVLAQSRGVGVRN